MSLLTNLTEYWKLDESSGNAVGSLNSIALTNNGVVPYSAGLINNGADFVPNDSMNNNAVLALTSYPRSFSAWVKFDTLASTDKAIISLGDGTTHYYCLKVRISDNHIVFRSNNSTQAGDVDTGIVATTGVWYHCVVIQNSTTSVTIYIDNVETNTAATTFVANVSQFYIGYLGRSAAWYLDGMMDEVGIWNRALTSVDVDDLYNDGAGAVYPFSTPSVPISVPSAPADKYLLVSGTNGRYVPQTGASTSFLKADGSVDSTTYYKSGDTVSFANITDTGLTASKVVFTDGSKLLTSTGIGTSGQFIKGDGSLDSTTYNSGAGATGQVAYYTGTNTTEGSANLTYDSTNDILTLGSLAGTTSTDRKTLLINAGGYGAPGAFNVNSNGDKIILYRNLASTYDGTIGVGSGADMWFKSVSSGATGNFKWYTGSGTQSMVLTSGGRLGIGTTAPLYDLDVKGTSALMARFQSNSASQAYIVVADSSATPTSGYSYMGHSVVGAESIGTFATPPNGIGFATTKYGGASIPFFAAGADLTGFSAWADARPQNGELWATGVGINLGKASPSYALEATPYSGTATEYPYSNDFTLTNIPVVPGSIGGYSDYSSLYDDGAGNIYGYYGVVATINYTTGVVTDNPAYAYETIQYISYNYGSPTVAKFNGVTEAPVIEGWNNPGGPFYPSLVLKPGGAGQTIDFRLQYLNTTQASFVGFRQTAPSAADIQRVFQFTDYNNTVEYFYQGIDNNANSVFVLPNNKKFRFVRVNAGTFDILTVDSQNQRVSIGNFTAPSAKLHVIATTEQLRLGYDTSNYFSTTVDSTGNATLNLTASSGTPLFKFSDTIVPTTNDLSALGTTALMWSDLFLASGGVINFNNGDVTLTHSSNKLTLAGGNLGVNGSTYLGDGGTTNYTEFEADGTMKMVGTATVFDDLYIDIAPKTTGAGKPTLATFNGNVNKYTFAVNDVSDLSTVELKHNWKEGSAIEIHVHWATNGTNDATVRGVKWEVDYTWANMQSAGGTIVFPAVTTSSAETSIAANETDKTHKYTSVVSFTPTGGKIGANLLLSLKRIASVTNVAPASDPFCLMVGVHYEIDTIGSRTTSSK